MSVRTLRFGVSGLGRGFVLSLPMFKADPRIRLVAAADPRLEARRQFEAEFAGRAYEDFRALCEDPRVEVVYVASPHQFHAPQAIAAARAGKHVLVEKPMALSGEECRAMIAAAAAARVQLIVGPSHGFDAPVALARAEIESGAHGAVRMISALNYTDFLYRPRRPEELDPDAGGGVVLSQGAHQIDVVRRLVGAPLRTIRAQVGDFLPERRTEGAYSAFLGFEGGASATLVYSGYGRFDSDELCGWIGETGYPKDPRAYGESRARLRAGASESALKEARAYGQAAVAPQAAPAHHEHFGFVVASCERADLRLMPNGVMAYGEHERRMLELPPPQVPRGEVVDELYAAIVEGHPPLHDGEWGRATLEACLALRRSAREGREIVLE